MTLIYKQIQEFLNPCKCCSFFFVLSFLTKMYIAALVFEFHNSILTKKINCTIIMKCKLPIKQIQMKEVLGERGGGRGGLEFDLTELCFPSPGL